MNHLFVGKTSKLPSSGKNKLVTDGPRITELPMAKKSGLLAKQLQAVAKARAASKCQRMRSGYSQSSNTSITTTGKATASTSNMCATPQAQIASSSTHNITSQKNCEEDSDVDKHSPSLVLAVVNDKKLKNAITEHENSQAVDQTCDIQCDEKDINVDLESNVCIEKVDEKCDSNAENCNKTSDCISEYDQTKVAWKIQERPLELIEIGENVLDNHTVPSNEFSLTKDCMLNESNDSTLEKTSENELVLSNLPKINLSTSSNDIFVNSNSSTSKSGLIIDDSIPVVSSLSPSSSCHMSSNIDVFQDDSGIESSSTASPSFTPGKQFSHNKTLRSSQTSHDNEDDDEELILSVETTFMSDNENDIAKMISVSQVGNAKHKMENLQQNVSPFDKVDVVNSQCDKIKTTVQDLDNLKENNLSSSSHINNEERRDGLERNEQSFPAPNSPLDDKTLLGMVSTTSPQRRFIRSLSLAEKSYTPSPSLIGTVPIAENLDVIEDGNNTKLSKKETSEGEHEHFSDAISITASSSKTNPPQNKAKVCNEPVNGDTLLSDDKTSNSSSRSKISSSYSESKRRFSSFAQSPSSSPHPLYPNLDVAEQDSSKLLSHKPFNPFPIKLLNANRAKTGLKLGLYSPMTLQQLKGFKGRTPSS